MAEIRTTAYCDYCKQEQKLSVELFSFKVVDLETKECIYVDSADGHVNCAVCDREVKLSRDDENDLLGFAFEVS